VDADGPAGRGTNDLSVLDQQHVSPPSQARTLAGPARGYHLAGGHASRGASSTPREAPWPPCARS